MRRCVVHVGTHKTGSTSIQMLLHTGAVELAGRNWLYPVSGRPAAVPTGHHNLAWEISQDFRFRSENGALRDLLEEIAATPSDIVLSSEDFECSIHRRERFSAFLGALRQAGLSLTIVVYLRNQVDYAVSLYFELLKHGLDEPFSSFLAAIVKSGQFTWKQWTFWFSYAEMLRQLEAHEDVELVVRSFDHCAGQSLLEDFKSVLGWEPGAAVVEDVKSNARLSPVDAFRLFCVNRHGAVVASEHGAAVIAAMDGLVRTGDRMSAESVEQLEEAFGESTRAVLEKYGLPPFGSRPRPTLHGRPLSVEAVFSSEMAQCTADLASMVGAHPSSATSCIAAH